MKLCWCHSIEANMKYWMQRQQNTRTIFEIVDVNQYGVSLHFGQMCNFTGEDKVAQKDKKYSVSPCLMIIIVNRGA